MIYAIVMPHHKLVSVRIRTLRLRVSSFHMNIAITFRMLSSSRSMLYNKAFNDRHTVS